MGWSSWMVRTLYQILRPNIWKDAASMGKDNFRFGHRSRMPPLPKQWPGRLGHHAQQIVQV